MKKKNQIGGEIREVTREEFYSLFRGDIHPQLDALAALNGVEALVCFEVLDMCSSRLGMRTGVAVGHRRTWKVEDLEHARIGDVPSRFAYPVAMWRISGLPEDKRDFHPGEEAVTFKQFCQHLYNIREGWANKEFWNKSEDDLEQVLFNLAASFSMLKGTHEEIDAAAVGLSATISEFMFRFQYAKDKKKEGEGNA